MKISEEVLKKIDGRYASCKSFGLDKFLRENPDVDKCLDELVKSDPWFKTKHIAFTLAGLHLFEPIRCAACGKELDAYRYLSNKGTRYCCRKCSQSAPERLEKVKRTSLERYGAENAMQSKNIQDKLKNTLVERYGVENAFASDDVKEKIRQYNLDKYGVEHYTQTDDHRQKTIKTNLERYGVEQVLQSDEVRGKAAATNLERYGGVAPACSQEVVDKMKATNMERYGVECSLNNEDINAKRQETWKEKYGGNPSISDEVKQTKLETNYRLFGAKTYFNSIHFLGKYYDRLKQRFAGKIEPLFPVEEYKGVNCKKKYKWRCLKCGNEFEAHLHITDIDPDERFLPRCLVCHPYMSGESAEENEVLDFVKSIYDGEVVHGDRSVISPLELDIYIPNRNLAIEFDGIYWHSEENGKGEDYHIGKTIACEKQGVRLIHIFEDEWMNKQDIVKDRIKSALGIYDSRIYARRCEVKEIDFQESNDFLERNHLQGSGHSELQYGLFYENELVSVMTFGKPRFNKNYDWELIRFASKLGAQVVGGASKLLKYFRDRHEGSMISYADRRYSGGKLYESIGFTKVNESKPNYWYVRGELKLSRYQCQKHKLAKLLGEFYCDDMSEYENMMFNGFERVFDCGNLVYAIGR